MRTTLHHTPLVRVLAVAAVAVLASACSGNGGGYAPKTTGGAAARHMTALSFSYQTVDDPASATNEVNGINGLGQITGTIGDGSPSNPYLGYTSQAPYTTFDVQQYSGAQGTVAMVLSSDASTPVMAGYVIHPPQLPGIWAFVRINGIWSLFRDRKGGKGTTTATEVLGINDSDFGVGFYKSTAGVNMPVVLNVPLEKFNALKPPNSLGAEATGINNLNDIVGWESTSAGVVGFFERAGRYYSLAYPTATATQPLSVNTQEQVVGSYQDSSGATHGFVLTNPMSAPQQQIWQSVDEPNAVNGTVVTGINDGDSICGYYYDAAGVKHGFVATPQ